MQNHGPLELLFERPGLPAVEMPAALRALYPGAFGFVAPTLFANFVASVDGVVALRTDRESGHLISGDNSADRFVMALLRAYADAVLVGASTFRKACREGGEGGHWNAESLHPSAAALFADWRQRLGLAARPTLVVVSASGELDPAAPALESALIATTPAGEARLRGRLGPGARMLAFGAARVDLRALLERLRAEGLRTVLTEGGPSLVGQLIGERLLDELFLTVSPALFGRYAADGRKSLLEGLDLTGAALELLGARRHRSHLFLRYSLRGDVAQSLS